MNLPLLLLVALLGMGTQSQLVFGEISSRSTMGANPHHPEDEPRDPATGLPKPGAILHNPEDRNSEEPKESLDIKDSKAVSKALDEVFKDPETAEAKLTELLSKLSPEDEENLRKLVNEQYQESISRFQKIKDQTPPPKKEFESAEKEYQKWDRARSQLAERKRNREAKVDEDVPPAPALSSGPSAAAPTPAPADDAPAAPALKPAAIGPGPKEISEKIGAGSTLGDGRKIKPADDVDNIRAFLVEKEAGSNHFVYVSEKGVSVDEQGKLTADLAHGVRFHDEKARTADMTFTDRESGATYSVNAQTGTTEVADPKTRIISAIDKDAVPPAVSTVISKPGSSSNQEASTPKIDSKSSGNKSVSSSKAPEGWICDGDTCRPPSLSNNNSSDRLLEEASPEPQDSWCCYTAGNCGPCKSLLGTSLPAGNFSIVAGGSSQIPQGTNISVQKFTRYQDAPFPVPSLVKTSPNGKKTIFTGSAAVKQYLGQETVDRIRRGQVR